jgi:hypothetical protein
MSHQSLSSLSGPQWAMVNYIYACLSIILVYAWQLTLKVVRPLVTLAFQNVVILSQRLQMTDSDYQGYY